MRHFKRPKKANLTKTPLKNMGNLTPKPIIQHENKKLISKLEKLKLLIFQKEEVSHIKNKYKKLKIKKRAPNWVQKNIK